jgi:hypothetical protein
MFSKFGHEKLNYLDTVSTKDSSCSSQIHFRPKIIPVWTMEQTTEV